MSEAISFAALEMHIAGALLVGGFIVAKSILIRGYKRKGSYRRVFGST